MFNIKKIPLVMAAAMSVALCVSCSKNSTEAGINDTSTALASLKSEIVSLNDSYPNSGNIETKAKWWHYALVAAADAGGFFLSGGVAGGPPAVSAAASVSSLVWNVVKEDRTTTESESVPVSVNSPDVALTFVDGEGALHNQIILSLYSQYGEDMFSLPNDQLISLIEQETATLMGVPLSEAAITPLMRKKVVYFTVNAYLTSSTIDEFVNKLKLSATDKAALLDIIDEILEGFDSINVVEDNGNYAQEVNMRIDSSDLPDTTKSTLKATVSVANASSRLWIIE